LEAGFAMKLRSSPTSASYKAKTIISWVPRPGIQRLFLGLSCLLDAQIMLVPLMLLKKAGRFLHWATTPILVGLLPSCGAVT